MAHRPTNSEAATSVDANSSEHITPAQDGGSGSPDGPRYINVYTDWIKENWGILPKLSEHRKYRASAPRPDKSILTRRVMEHTYSIAVCSITQMVYVQFDTLSNLRSEQSTGQKWGGVNEIRYSTKYKESVDL